MAIDTARIELRSPQRPPRKKTQDEKKKEDETRLEPGIRAYLPVRRGEGSDGNLHAPRGESGGLRAQFLILERRSENVERVHLRHVDAFGSAARDATPTHAIAVVRLRRERGEMEERWRR